jgi:uncharacterized UBP type Zn finger protein
MTTTPNDKVVLTKYPIAPSVCVICLRSSNGELDYIDFQMSLDIYGSVNICVECVASVAKSHLDMVSREEYEDTLEQIRNLVEINRELADNNERLNATMDSLVNLRPSLVERRLPVNEDTD